MATIINLEQINAALPQIDVVGDIVDDLVDHRGPAQLCMHMHVVHLRS